MAEDRQERWRETGREGERQRKRERDRDRDWIRLNPAIQFRSLMEVIRMQVFELSPAVF